jgi:asparagine synthase (glutamine-hydrolysing)
MCGIAGIINKNNDVGFQELKLMCDQLSLRGPDAEGFYIERNIGLGHRRLSVIDLDTGDQPMFSRDKSISIVFNGEIYNFQSLRAELEAKKHTFQTQSDTEVIINGYIEYGINKLLQKLEGMFAFALFDKNSSMVYIARDKFGEKPLYYFADDNKFLFASELKAFEKILPTPSISKYGLNYFLSLNYIPAPYTIYNDVYKLKAGNYITISGDFRCRITRYYSLIEKISGQNKYGDFNKCKSELREMLFDSVKKRMIADVPLGVFLSGGIDSSIIATIMSRISKEPIKTFSIGFNEKAYDESERANIIADNIKSIHSIHFLNYDDVVGLVDEIILHFDEPFGDSSAIPTYYVAKLAREKVTVVLTGDCADELFIGYEKYLGLLYSGIYKALPSFVKGLIKGIISLIPHTKTTNVVLRKIKKVINNTSLSDFDLQYNLMCLGFNDNERSDLLIHDKYIDIKQNINNIYSSFVTNSSLEKGIYTDLNVVLEGDMLPKVDRMCMRNSLEARIPFLDSKIVEAAYRMPINYKLKGKDKKHILKETFKDLLPKKTLKFVKKGFAVPIDYWLQNELNYKLNEVISEKFINEQNIFNYEEIKRIYNEHMNRKENHMNKLWNIYVFQKWYMAKILNKVGVNSEVSI